MNCPRFVDRVNYHYHYTPLVHRLCFKVFGVILTVFLSIFGQCFYTYFDSVLVPFCDFELILDS